MYMLLLATLIFLDIFHADRFSERCTNAVASPIGVTGA